MRKLLLCLLALALAVLPALAEDIEVQPEGYTNCGYMPGGITFLIPEEMVSCELYDWEIQAGMLLYAESETCSIQLRRFEADAMNQDQFLELVKQEPTVQWEILQDRGTPVLYYRNQAPNAATELVGVVITGTDGCMYKVSVFTGWDENFAADAPVWEIARVLAESIRHENFSFVLGAK